VAVLFAKIATMTNQVFVIATVANSQPMQL